MQQKLKPGCLNRFFQVQHNILKIYSNKHTWICSLFQILKKNFLQRKKTQEVLKCIEDGKRQMKVLRRQYDILKKVGTLVSEPQLKHVKVNILYQSTLPWVAYKLH